MVRHASAMRENGFQSNVEEILQIGSAMEAPWVRHVMEKHHGKKNVSILMLRKLFHKGRHASAMEKNSFLMLRKQIAWGDMVERHVSAMSAMQAPCRKKNSFYPKGKTFT